jgi:hypothetical protein
MHNEEMYSTWTNESDMGKALAQSSDAYSENSPVQPEKALGYTYRTYLDIEPNRSVRTSMTRNDYYRFRPEEAVPTRQKRIIKMCMDAYDRVGIVRNVIDLMGDFGAQGIDIVHQNKSIERFYKKWFEQVNGVERSERFLNYLYRAGNVIIKRRTAKVNASKEAELRRSSAADMDIEATKYVKREIPWAYDFLNPLAVDVLNFYNGMFIGDPIFIMNLSRTTYDSFTASNVTARNTFSKLPPDLQKMVKEGKRQIPLDKDKLEVYYYKKDDWLVWANPMIYAILDDLIMLEKMKLADLAALDGAISQIRLWRVGSLDHKIIPRRDVINKIRDILASNTGGGTMDLVWGPELDFKESQSQVYRFLGSEKYQPVLTSIYAGLGIPPTLTGASTGGGYSNNYVSLKTLIERLEYGRQILTKFWTKEIEIVQKAMGFKYPAQIRFDSIILSDESAAKQLLINLADRAIISNETVLERFGEMPDIEKTRLRREEQTRRNDTVAPQKASPYHNPNIRNDVAKILVTKDGLSDEYYEDLQLPKQDIPLPMPKSPIGDGNPDAKKSPEGNPQGGRPTNSKDSVKRKTKRVLPRSGESAAVLWAYNAQKTIAELVTPMMLEYYDKKNVRSLTKAEFDQLEYLKLCLLTGIQPFIEITPEVVKDLIDKSLKPSDDFISEVSAELNNFVYINNRKPTVDETKYIYATVYTKQVEVNDEDIQS